MDGFNELLQSEYGIIPRAISRVPGGFSAKAAYRVMGADGTEYFLKVYDKSLPTTRFFIKRIDAYMPVLDWLSALPSLRGRVLTPFRARGGAYQAETKDDACVLFLFVHGDVPGVGGMTRAQTVELAKTLALLHEAGETLAHEPPGLAEDISLSFCDRLACFLRGKGAEHGALSDIVRPHADLLLSAIDETLRLRDTVRLGFGPLLLCHGDAHGNNVIQGEQLVLADWEDLRWAPAEADLFIHAWHPHGDVLLNAYAAARSDYPINRELLFFYTLRRRIEDVWVDIQRLTEERPDEAETEKLLDYVRRGIGEVRALYHHGKSR